MATQNLTSADAYLKNVYYGPWVEQLNQETAILDVLEKTNANDMGTFGGRQLIFVAHSNRNRGRGGQTDGGTLATAGTQGGVDGIVNIKYFNVAIELSDQVIRQTKTDAGSFVRSLTFEMEMAQKDMRKDVTRIAYGTGDGLLATVTGTPGAGTSITVDSGQYIAVGDTVDIVLKSTGVVTNGILATVVTAVAYTGTAASATQANATLTIGTPTAGATANTYGVYLAGDRSNESDGLRNICSTARTLHQINSSTAGNGFWDSNVKDFANAAPSEDGIMQLAQQIRQRSGFTPKFGMMTLGGQRRLANTYTSAKRFNDNNATEYKGGYDTIFVSAGGNPLPMRADVDAPCGTFFLLNEDGLCWSQIGPPDWMQPPDDRGSVFQLKSTATAGVWARIWQAWLVWDACLVSIAPNRQGKGINVFDDIPVARL